MKTQNSAIELYREINTAILSEATLPKGWGAWAKDGPEE
jgi:hypothetical protein